MIFRDCTNGGDTMPVVFKTSVFSELDENLKQINTNILKPEGVF